MQAVIMAAGKGSRINLTKKHPKCYLEINGKRLIDHQLDTLRLNGISDIIMVVGHMKDTIKSDYANQGITFVENPFFGVINVLSSFWFSLPFIKDNFIYLHADTIFEPAVFEKMMECNEKLVLPVDYKVCGEEEMKVNIQDGKIIEINKTMSSSTADGEFIGIAKIHKSLVSHLQEASDNILFEEKYNSFFESAVQEIISDNIVDATPVDITGLKWNEIDFEEDFVHSLNLFSSSKIK